MTAQTPPFEVGSVSEFVKIAGSPNDGGTVRWFRGISSTQYELKPTLYRLKSEASGPVLGINRLLDVEEWLLDRFSERSAPFREGPSPVVKIDYLFEMQHYGVPTRLLDWSESALVALWFAVQGKADEFDAAIWVLNPAKWNDLVFSQQRSVNNVLSPHSETVDSMQPWTATRRDVLADPPVCIYGVHNTKRIVSQRGVFTLGGLSTSSIEDQAGELARAGSCSSKDLLFRITIPAAARPQIRAELVNLGFTQSMIFPDLTGLARELVERLDESGLL
ncbi:FRG domain-containing protein [Gordonia sp. (in: high G+C Gram-positive bacteria)]|uniref:FRG domain-containing protein n=1 Tax=Gordonia sp. (in: high G+C Gram-positive bacteria) TaxID=84139 RepID=UPI003C718251